MMSDELLRALRPIIEAVDINDGDTLSGVRPDSFVVWTASGSWGGSQTITLGDLRSVARAARQAATDEKIQAIVAAAKLYEQWARERGDYPHDEQGCNAHHAVIEAVRQMLPVKQATMSEPQNLTEETKP
jgi:hypothetical protein